MPEIEQIESAFESVSDAWQNCRESIGDLVDQKQGDEVFGWAENFRDAFLESCREVTDEVDRSYVMIVKYIEARCVWAKYTAKANYTTAYKDTVDGEAAGVLGEGPGASSELNVSLKKGDRTVVLLADHMGRRSDASGGYERKGVLGHLCEVGTIKPGKPEIIESDPIIPLEHQTPLMMVRDNDAAHPERVVWKFVHRKKAALHVILGPVPVRGVVMINDAFAGLVEPGESLRRTIEGEELNRGNNTVEFAPMDEPDPDSSMAKLASALSGVLRVVEVTNETTAKAEWAFAKWEPPQDAAFDTVPKTKLGSREAPSWWSCEFTVDGEPNGPLMLELGGMTKGQVYLNGRNLGRYFVATQDGTAVPPGGSVWVPACWLTEGANVLTVFDEHGGNPGKIKLAFDADRAPIEAGPTDA